MRCATGSRSSTPRSGSSSARAWTASRWTRSPARPAWARGRCSAASAIARRCCTRCSTRANAPCRRVLRGPPPLGPGAPPARRLGAFGEALLDLIEEHGDLIALAETGLPGLRLRSPVYLARRLHVVTLLAEADLGIDVDYTADALLGTLSADLVLHQRRAAGRSLEELKEGWRRLVAAVLTGSAPG